MQIIKQLKSTYLCWILITTLLLMLCHQGYAQPALHIEQSKSVLFGKDSVTTGTKFFWSPAKNSLRAGYFQAIDLTPDSIGEYSVSMGGRNRASGRYSVAMGLSSRATGHRSAVIGDYNIASGVSSFACGASNTASGIYSMATGVQNLAQSYASFVVGRWNLGGGDADTWFPADPLFEVGIGSFEDRRNGLTVFKNGLVKVGDPGDGHRLLEFNSERRWYFVQHGNGASTALKLQCDPNNNNKNFIIDTEGMVGISVNNPSYKFELPNDSNESGGQARAYDWDTYSDQRVKRNVQALAYGLPEIMRLNPIQYDHHSSNFKGDTLFVSPTVFGSEVGFIAQEVYELMPEMVSKPDDDSHDLWSLSYARMVPVLAKAIQEQQQIIANLQDELSLLKLQRRSPRKLKHDRKGGKVFRSRK